MPPGIHLDRGDIEVEERLVPVGIPIEGSERVPDHEDSGLPEEDHLPLVAGPVMARMGPSA